MNANASGKTTELNMSNGPSTHATTDVDHRPTLAVSEVLASGIGRESSDIRKPNALDWLILGHRHRVMHTLAEDNRSACILLFGPIHSGI